MPAQRPPANRMNLQVFKARLVGASKGYQLLKKKRDALKAKFSEIMKAIVIVKVEAGRTLKDCAFTGAKSHWAAAGDDFSAAVLGTARVPSITVKLGAEGVAGCTMPKFESCHDASKDTSVGTLGVGHGGAVIEHNRKTHQHAVKTLVKLASLQSAFATIDEEIKMTGRRVNALEYVVIPRIELVIADMIQELDEEAREEFYRVKKVVDKKKQKIEKEKQLLAMQAAQEAGSALDAGKDSDIVF
mmetsp:Transcript_40324/g.114063  ORF Transcript_40324/g.114063 Transcript_40324/m.114063 type:complete len:244 (-) Transcript_40324:123-854(-)